MLILKSRIFNELQKVKNKTRKIVEQEWQRKLDRALDEQREVYELIIHEKTLEIESLNYIIDKNREFMQEASQKEVNAKKYFVRAREIVSLCDYEFKKYLECQARFMANFAKIRDDAEGFTKKLFLK